MPTQIHRVAVSSALRTELRMLYLRTHASGYAIVNGRKIHGRVWGPLDGHVCLDVTDPSTGMVSRECVNAATNAVTDSEHIWATAVFFNEYTGASDQPEGFILAGSRRGRDVGELGGSPPLAWPFPCIVVNALGHPCRALVALPNAPGATARPNVIRISMDGTNTLDHIHWSTWGGETATAVATQELYAQAGALPAGAKPTAYPVAITATKTVPCGSQPFRVYEQLTIRYLGKRPVGEPTSFSLYGPTGGGSEMACR